MKVLCKKSYWDYGGISFDESEWYNVRLKENTHDKYGKVDSYFIECEIKNYGSRFVLENFDYKDYYLVKPERMNIFNEYFYTEQDVRKLKLEKLNEQNSIM